jgi:serine phosphatase RsbU (regulator of sigma subunit)
VLLDVGRAISTGLAVEDGLTAIVGAAIDLTRARYGVLLLVKPSGGLEAAVARDAQRVPLAFDQAHVSSSVLERVMCSRRDVIVDGTRAESSICREASAAPPGLHSAVAIPVKSRARASAGNLPLIKVLDMTIAERRRELLGVLYLADGMPSSSFLSLDHEVLRMLTREAALVIENARLFTTAREKARLDHEMEITSQIQRQLQPARFPRLPELEVTGFTVECHAVGGDCFDVIELSDGRHGLFVGDIAGKGIPASLLATLLQGVIGTIGALDLPLEEVISRVNLYLCERSAGDRYATLFYAILDSTGRFDYVNAGHIPALIRRRSGEVETLESSNFPVGMFSHAQYTRETVEIEPGDFLVMYTDGISEAKNGRGQLFKEAGGLQHLLQRFNGQTVDSLVDAIRSGVRAFTEGAPQSDDIAVLAVHYRGHAPMNRPSETEACILTEDRLCHSE